MDNGASSYRRYLDGDDEGLVHIIREYKDSLTLYINGLVRNIFVAEELMEETFFKLATKKPYFSGESSFKTWLFAVARNSAQTAQINNFLLAAASVKNIPSADTQGKRITVSISCKELGFNNKGLYIYEDGHVATNLTGHRFTFFVGKENVSRFAEECFGIDFSQLDTAVTIPETKDNNEQTTVCCSVPRVSQPYYTE